MIKVIILGLHSVIGGSETYINNTIKCFPKDEIICDFLVVGKEKTPYHDSINEFYNDGLDHFYYCLDLKKKPIEGWRWIENFYNEHHYDVIYLNATSAANAIYCKYAIDKMNIPLITHSHFTNGPWINHVLFRPYVNKHSVYKLACAEPSAKWMFGEKWMDAVCIPNGIDTNRFAYNPKDRVEIREKLGISDEVFLIGHVGRFSPEKNQKFLIELCQRLPSNYTIMCIGDGSCKEEIIKSRDNQGLKDRFIILPSNTEIERYYCAMDVFVMPSLYEGLPIVSVEAQCNGLPVIFSDTITKETQLSDECFYKDLSSPHEWIETITSIKKHRYDGVKCVIENGFSIQDTAKKIEIMIKDVCKETTYSR